MAKRVVRLLQRRGLLEEDNVDPLWEEEPLLATITAASVEEWSLLRGRVSQNPFGGAGFLGTIRAPSTSSNRDYVRERKAQSRGKWSDGRGTARRRRSSIR